MGAAGTMTLGVENANSENMPRVTVLMPVYNGERFLREAVDSVLVQTYADFEFIVVDDGSTDGTAQILDAYDDSRIVRLCHRANRGIVAALDWGLAVSRGELIARQDADDVALPSRLEEQVRLLDRHPELVIVGSASHLIDEGGTHLGTQCYPASDTAIRWQMLFHNSFVHTSVMVRAKVLRTNALRYDVQALHAEDYDLWSRLLCHGQGMNVGQALVKHRVHKDQIGQVAPVRQRQSADRIACSNLARLGVHLAEVEAGVLRRWHHRLPRRLRRQDVALCRALLRTLDAFGRQPDVDPHIVRDIRARWLGLIAAAAAGLRMDLFRTELAWDILRQVRPYTLAYLSRWAMRLMLKRAIRVPSVD